MGWSLSFSGGVARTHTGVVLDVFVWNEFPRGLYEMIIQCGLATGNIRGYVRGSGDGGSGFLVGIVGANVEIRKYTMRVAAAAPLATAAHNITAGESFTIRVRDFADKIEVAILKTDTVTTQITATTSEYGNQHAVGFATDVNNAVVLKFEVYELTSVAGQVVDVPFVVAGGTLFASYDGMGLSVIGSNLCAADVPVDADIWDGLVYIVGGGKAWVWDVVARTLSAASAIGHPTYALPGATTEGTTTATLICQFRARMIYAGMDAESSNLHCSAITEPLQLNTGELAAGAAIVLGTGRQATVYDTIVAMEPTSANTLLIPCLHSMFMMLGDPAEASADIVPVSRSYGASGPNAIAATSEGRIAVHSPEGGLLMVEGPSEPTLLSAPILSEGIQFPSEDRHLYRVSLVRDTQRHGLLIFLSKVDGTGTWFWYDELGGQHRPKSGGYWPIQFADGYEPMVTTTWRGQVLMFTRNGRVLKFDDTVASDNGVPFTTRVPFAAVVASDESADIVLSRIELIIGNDSGNVTLTVHAAANAEDAGNPATRVAVWSDTFTPLQHWSTYSARGPALLFTVSSASGIPWWLEGGRVVYEEEPRLQMSRMLPAAEPGHACGPSTTPTSGTDTTPEGPGGGTLPTGGGGPPVVVLDPSHTSEPISVITEF